MWKCMIQEGEKWRKNMCNIVCEGGMSGGNRHQGYR